MERVLVHSAYCLSQLNKETIMNDATARLRSALELLGYSRAKPYHYRSNLVHAIALFATAQGDLELETACEVEINAIRNEAAQSYVPGMDEGQDLAGNLGIIR